MPHIAKALERLAARVSQKETIVLSIARKQDEHKTLAQAKSALAGLSASRDEIEVRIDETLIGGWRLEGGEHLVDASYKMQLLDMYTAATAR
jgi:F0F1-type ATP synthase delta subunit